MSDVYALMKKLRPFTFNPPHNSLSYSLSYLLKLTAIFLGLQVAGKTSPKLVSVIFYIVARAT